MTKTLEMVFRTGAGNEASITLTDPKDELTLAEAQAAMQVIIDKNIFAVKGSQLVDIVEARILSRETVVLV